MNKRKVHCLVVDSGAFIKNAPIHEFGEKIFTVSGAVNEVKDGATRQRLQFLPYELKCREPSPEALKYVTEFSKKTGDYPSLSAVDIRIIALTFELEKELVGTDHLNREPTSAKLSGERIKPPTSLVGFYNPDETSGEWTKPTSHVGFYNPDERDDTENEKSSENCVESCSNLKEDSLFYETKNHIDSEEFVGRPEQSGPLPSEISSIGAGNTTNNYIFDENAQNESSLINTEDSNQEGTDSGCEGHWITPNNIGFIMKEKMGALSLNDCDTSISVSCITTDYAIQNVLLQMGLNVLSVDGMIIKQTKIFILRCYACYSTTYNMTKKFCPKCGNMTLKRVTVCVNEDGTKTIHINFKRPINIRGMKYSLPMPRGGKHAVNPVLCEDQPIPQNRPSKAALRKVNALDPDYIAGNSPFATNDLYSRASSLGIVGRQVGRNQSRNSNVSSRKKKNRRK